MFMPLSIVGRGLWLPTVSFRGIARVALARGEVGMFDIAATLGSSTDNDADGGSTSGLVNVADPNAISEQIAFAKCVALQAMSVGDEGEFLVFGITEVMCYKGGGNFEGSANLLKGARLTLQTATQANALSADANAANDELCVLGIALENATGSATPALVRTAFNGWTGWGIRSTRT